MMAVWGHFVVDGLVHTAPCDKRGQIVDHIESMNCWCAPTLRAHCPLCITGDPSSNCYRCNGTGFTEGSILDPPRVAAVLHRDMSHDDDA